jgi:hypothetical protein
MRWSKIANMETETEVWIDGGSSGEEDSQDENEIGIHDDDQANQVKKFHSRHTMPRCGHENRTKIKLAFFTV